MDGFKQRLIGALVLISLAVIFVPMLLDEPHEERTTRTIEIPQEPDFPEVRIERATPPEPDSSIATVPEPENPPLQTRRSQPQDSVESMSGDQRVPSPAASDQNPSSGSVVTAPQQAPAPASRRAPEVQRSAEPPQAPRSTPEAAASTAGAASSEPIAKSDGASSSREVAAQESALQAGGYLVQLGSFSSSSNARALKDSVAAAGFSAHTTTIESDGKAFTRVFAGPFSGKDAAATAKREIDSKFGLNSLVIVND